MSGIWFRFNVIWHLPTIIKSLWCSPCAAAMSSWLALGDGKWGWLGTESMGDLEGGHLHPTLVGCTRHWSSLIPWSPSLFLEALLLPLILKVLFPFQHLFTCPFALPVPLAQKSTPLCKEQTLLQLYRDKKIHKKLQGNFMTTHCGSIVPEGIWESLGFPLPPPYFISVLLCRPSTNEFSLLLQPLHRVLHSFPTSCPQ